MVKENSMGKILHRVINGVAEVLATPSKIKHESRGIRYDAYRKTVTTARGYDNAPNYDERGNVTEAFKSRSLRKDIKKASYSGK